MIIFNYLIWAILLTLGLGVCSAKAKDIILLCDRIKGSSGTIGWNSSSNTIDPDSITNGLLVFRISNDENLLGINLHFRDASGQFVDAKQDGAVLSVVRDDLNDEVFVVEARYPFAKEKFLIRVQNNKEAKLLYSQERNILGNWKIAVYSAVCAVQ